jgi:hypothetical protein
MRVLTAVWPWSVLRKERPWGARKRSALFLWPVPPPVALYREGIERFSAYPSSGAEGAKREAAVDQEQKDKQLLEIVQAIAIGAMEAPPDRRTEFIECALGKMCETYEKKQGRASLTAHQISTLLKLTKDMVRILETSGNTVGHA